MFKSLVNKFADKLIDASNCLSRLEEEIKNNNYSLAQHGNKTASYTTKQKIQMEVAEEVFKDEELVKKMYDVAKSNVIKYATSK